MRKYLLFIIFFLSISYSFSLDYNNLVAVVQEEGAFIYSSYGETIGEVIPYVQLDIIGQYNNFWGVILPDGRTGFINTTDVYIYESNITPSLCNQTSFLITAYNLLGVPYIFGGTSPYEGFDCSGFVYYVFFQNGLELPRKASEQFKVGIPIRTSNLLPGDLIFFAKDYQGVSHVGIYWGGGYFIHASSNRGVIFTPLSKEYYRLRFTGARRI